MIRYEKNPVEVEPKSKKLWTQVGYGVIRKHQDSQLFKELQFCKLGEEQLNKNMLNIIGW